MSMLKESINLTRELKTQQEIVKTLEDCGSQTSMKCTRDIYDRSQYSLAICEKVAEKFRLYSDKEAKVLATCKSNGVSSSTLTITVIDADKR